MSAEILAALQSIDATLKELLVLSKSKRAAVQSPHFSTAHGHASDADLDSQYGDEPVKFQPRDWTGVFSKGQRMSESEPAMLDLLAEAFASFATKNDMTGEKATNGTPKSFYDNRSASRARGWAQRLRNGWKPKTPSHVPASDIQW